MISIIRVSRAVFEIETKREPVHSIVGIIAPPYSKPNFFNKKTAIGCELLI